MVSWNWVKNLPVDVQNRLGHCKSRKEDIPILVNTKWSEMVEEGKEEKGYTKEDALIYIMELLDYNGQYFDLTRCEYDDLKD